MSGPVVWLTGLPSSGKTTLARAVAARLSGRAVVLDSDEVRQALVPSPGYGTDARAFYETLGNLAVMLARQGLIVLVSATAHRRAFRDRVRAVSPGFVEVFVDTPLDECRRRDAKGLYASRAVGLPGAGVEYEPPSNPEIRVTPSDGAGVEQIVAAALRASPH